MTHSTQDIRLSAYAVLAMACLALGWHTASAADKPKTPELSRIISKEMSAAQKAMQAQQWNEALKNLEAAEAKGADAKPPFTAYDKNRIYDFKGYSYVKLNKLKDAQTAYEAAVATGAYPPDELGKTNKLLFRLTAGNQQYAKAIEFGKQVSEEGAANAEDLAIMSQLYYLQKDCKNSAVWGEKSAAASKKAGEAPRENLLQFKLSCADEANDGQGRTAALYELVRLTNKTQYWNNLIRLERQDEREDRNILMIYRIMYDTKSMNADTDYIEMAQLLADAGLPGEAANVLDSVMSTPMMKDEHKERTTRLVNSLRTRAEADKKGLAQLDADAAKNAAGIQSLSAGEAHYATGDFQGAVTALTAAIQKGQLKHPEEAYVYLGRSQVALKNYPDAKKAFAQVKTVPGVSPRVAKLWDLYAESLGR
jgi:hypothetical protein